MVEDRLRDGRRLAELFASEVTGDPDVGATVVDADREVTPSPEGAFAYAVATGAPDASGDVARVRVAEAFVHPDRVHLEFHAGQAAAADAADAAGLRVRPKAVRPPRTLVFLEDGAEVKRAVAVLRAALQAVEDGG
jgi:hypothetical protein